MKKPINIIMLTAGLVILFGAPNIAWSSAFQTSEVYSVATGEPVAGGGTLNRYDGSVQLRVSIAGLDKKSTYSAWYIIFNNPEDCGFGSGVCTGADLGADGIDWAVFNAGGFVTGTDGTGYFAGELEVGDIPAGMAGFGGALSHGMNSEIHIVIQTHSKHDIGAVSHQMSVPDGVDQLFLIFPPAQD